jgi:hypothetical protein
MRDAIMAMAMAVLSAVAVAAGSGCGSSDGGGPLPIGGNNQGGTAAKEMFLKEVYPALQLTCAFCHSVPKNPVNAPLWMGFDAQASYSAIEKQEGLVACPDNSKLLLKGEHTGPALTPTQLKAAKAWLEAEAKERGLDCTKKTDPVKPNAPPKLTADEALDQFGKCMKLDDFKKTNVHLLAYEQTAGWGPCAGCHNTGWAGAFIDDDVQLMFEQNRKKPFILKLVEFTTQGGEFKDLVVSKRFAAKGTELCGYTGKNEKLCHPKYTLIPKEQGGTDIEGFFKITHDRWKKTNGKCDGAGGGDGGGGAGGAGGQ